MLLTKQLKDITKTKKDRFFIKNKKAQRNAVLFCWWTRRESNSRPITISILFYIISFFVSTFVIHLETNPLTNGIW